MPITKHSSQPVSEEHMYEAWVASGRQTAKTAAILDMEYETLRYYVKKRKWNVRYIQEFQSEAIDSRKAALLELVTGFPTTIRVLNDFVANESLKVSERVAAANTLRNYLPMLMMDAQHAPPPITLEGARLLAIAAPRTAEENAMVREEPLPMAIAPSEPSDDELERMVMETIHRHVETHDTQE